MKKFIIGYMKVTAKLWVVYALVAWIGDWITDRHPLKDEGQQSYVKLLFAVMKMCVLSPYYEIKGLIDYVSKKDEPVNLRAEMEKMKNTKVAE